MEIIFLKSNIIKTAFVVLDTKKCEGCWNCFKVCKNNVISRINFLWHKHIILVNVDR